MRTDRLVKILQKLPNKTYIKMGSIDGNGFWYVGTRDEFLKSHEAFSKKMREYCEDRLDRARNVLFRLAKQAPSWSQFLIDEFALADKQRREPSALTYDDYLNAVKAYEAKLKRSAERAKDLKMYLDSFVDLKSREVIETREAITENALIILIVGNEEGAFWTISEAEKSTLKFNRGE